MRSSASVIDNFANWSMNSWNVGKLPEALGKLSGSASGFENETSVGKKTYMLILRHALGGEKVRLLVTQYWSSWVL